MIFKFKVARYFSKKYTSKKFIVFMSQKILKERFKDFLEPFPKKRI